MVNKGLLCGKEFIPFLVVDRPASLRIIRGLKIPREKRIGLMSHANTSNFFKGIFAHFPCSEREYCEVLGKNCPYKKDISKCAEGSNFKGRITKIADSGVFTKEGCMFSSYENLYNEYEKMNVDYGIMIDYLKDKEKTLESAREALEVYELCNWNFKIIGVAQGLTVEDYLDCYKKFKDMGFQYVAIGGLLKKRINTARYVQVRDERLFWSVLSKIKEMDPNGWVFALGCYAPSRRDKFLKLGIYGSDYKGWIFQYDKKYPDTKRGNIKAKMSRYYQVRRFIYDRVIEKSQIPLTGNLLIIPCSKSKTDFRKEVEAIELYNGPFYKLIRKYIRERNITDYVDIFVLSAKYGLIEANTKINYYDLRMDSQRAKELNKAVLKSLADIVNNGKNYNTMLINVGRRYLLSLEGYEKILPKNVHITIAEGKIGERMRIMKSWLDSIIYNNIGELELDKSQ